MYRFCIAESDIAPKHVFQFNAVGQRAFIGGATSALLRLREVQPAWGRAHGVYLFAGTEHGWTHVRNNSMRVIGLDERLVFSRPDELWGWAYKTAWGANYMDEQLDQLIDFLKYTPEERRAHRRSKLTLIPGGWDG